jgi:hypothetical protein
MTTHDEHDDDLEPEVIEGAAIETEQYEEADEEDIAPEMDTTNPTPSTERGSISRDVELEESEDEAGDTI